MSLSAETVTSVSKSEEYAQKLVSAEEYKIQYTATQILKDLDKQSQLDVADNFKDSNTFKTGKEYSDGLYLTNEVAEQDKQSRRSIEGRDLTEKLLDNAMENTDFAPGTAARIANSPNNIVYKNLDRAVLDAIIRVKESNNQKLTDYETAALINRKILQTEAVLIEVKKPLRELEEPTVIAAAQNIVLQKAGVKLYSDKEIKDGIPGKMVAQSIKDIVNWGEQNKGDKIKPGNDMNQREGFVSSTKTPFVPEGFTVSYDSSLPEVKVISIHANDNLPNSANVIIELYPSPVDLRTNPQIKEVYINYNGKKIPLKINTDNLGTDDINKIAWLFKERVSESDSESSSNITQENTDRLNNAKIRDQLYKEYNVLLADKSIDWNSSENVNKKRDYENLIDEINRGLNASSNNVINAEGMSSNQKSIIESSINKIRETEGANTTMPPKKQVVSETNPAAGTPDEITAKELEPESPKTAQQEVIDLEAKVLEKDQQIAELTTQLKELTDKVTTLSAALENLTKKEETFDPQTASTELRNIVKEPLDVQEQDEALDLYVDVHLYASLPQKEQSDYRRDYFRFLDQANNRRKNGNKPKK